MVVTSPASAAKILELIAKQLVSGTPHAIGAVSVTPPRTKNAEDQSEIQWDFRDDQGRAWHGAAIVEPSPRETGRFTVTMKLAHQ